MQYQKLPHGGDAISMGFSLLRTFPFFVFRKMEMLETKTHFYGWRDVKCSGYAFFVFFILDMKILFFFQKGLSSSVAF